MSPINNGANLYPERREQIRLMLIEGSRLADRCGFLWDLDIDALGSDYETYVLRVRVGKRPAVGGEGL